MKLSNTVERINPVHYATREKYLLYLRHVFAYEYIVRHLDAGASVLEIGFGEGYGTCLLAEKAGTVQAIDVDRKVVDYGNHRHSTANCRFQHYDGCTIPFPGAHFDTVVTLQVIEHVGDDAGFVAEAARVLKPGGTLWLTTPNRTHRIPPGGKIWNPFHLREYYPHELESVLAQAFEDVNVWGIRGDAEAQQIEIDRVKRGFCVRKLIPDTIKSWLDGDVRARYSTSNFDVEPARPADGLDLLGVCRRPRA